MQNNIRTVTFVLDVQSVTPDTPQFAGVAGDDGATLLVLQPTQALCPDGAQYRIACIDGLGQAHTSDLLELTDRGTLEMPIPAAWTAAGGSLSVQAVAQVVQPNGETEMSVYSLPAQMYLIGSDGESPVRRSVGTLLADCHTAVDAAQQAAAQALQCAGEASGMADIAQNGAQWAMQYADEAAQYAEGVRQVSGNLCNALVRHAQGGAVRLRHLSPLTDTVSVQLENTDVVGQPILHYGKNLVDALSVYAGRSDVTVDGDIVSGPSNRVQVVRMTIPDQLIGQTVTFSALLRCDGPAETAKALVAIYNADGSSQMGSAVAAGDLEMQRSVVTRTVRSGDRFIVNNTGAGSANQTVWIRDAQVEYGTVATEYCPYKEPQTRYTDAEGVLTVQVQNEDTLIAPAGGRLDTRYNADINAVLEEAGIL